MQVRCVGKTNCFVPITKAFTLPQNSVFIIIITIRHAYLRIRNISEGVLFSRTHNLMSAFLLFKCDEETVLKECRLLGCYAVCLL
jgi:hypothetical protein